MYALKCLFISFLVLGSSLALDLVSPFSSHRSLSDHDLLVKRSAQPRNLRRDEERLYTRGNAMSQLKQKKGQQIQREWLVVVPDHVGVAALRTSARSEHLQNVKPHIESGKVTLGGATLAEHPEPDQPHRMNGSAFVVAADSREELLQFIRQDVYARKGVWNLDRATILPVSCDPCLRKWSISTGLVTVNSLSVMDAAYFEMERLRDALSLTKHGCADDYSLKRP